MGGYSPAYTVRLNPIEVNLDSHHLLLVAISLEATQAIASVLEERGFQIHKATSLPEVLDRVLNPAIELVLLTLQSEPGFDPFLAILAIQDFRSLPIVVLSDPSQEALLQDARRLTFSAILPLNCSPLLLSIVIENALAQFQSTQAVASNEAKFRSIYESSPIGLEIYNQAGLLIGLNQACLDLFGVEDDRELRDFNLFNDPNLPVEMSAALRAGHQAHYQFWFDFNKVRQHHLYRTRRSGAAWLDVQISLLGANPLLPDGYLVHIQDFSSRKESEEALAASEELYRLLAENVTDVIWILDLVTFRFRYVSPSVQQLRGYSPDEVLAQDSSAALTPASARFLAENLPARILAFQNGDLTNHIDEMEQPCRDGSTVWTEVTTHFQVNPQNTHLEVFGVSRNIQDRHTAEAESRLSLEKYRAIFNSFPLGIAITDHTDRIVESNQAAERILGVKPGSLDHPYPPIQELWQTQPADGSPLPFEKITNTHAGHENHLVKNRVLEYIRPDSRSAWLSVSAAPIQHEAYSAAIIFADVTTQRKMEQELRDSEEKNRVLFENDIYAVYMIDLETHAFLDANPACESLLGYTRAEMLSGMKVEDISAEIEATQAGLQQFLRTGSIFVPRRSLRRKNGQIFSAEIAGGPFVWRGKKCLYAQLRDISERERSEAEIQRLLGEKELLLQEVHHRIKNNMSTISSLLQLQAFSLGEGSASDSLQQARSRIESMMALYERLYRSGNYRQVNLRAYFSTLLDEIMRSWRLPGQQVSLNWEIEEIEADTRLTIPLAIILNEWITNAFKYAFPAGRPGVIEINIRQADASLIISVSDNGVGIPEQVDNYQGGSFGMRLVSLLCSQLQGNLDLTRNNGTTFNLTIPFSPDLS